MNAPATAVTTKDKLAQELEIIRPEIMKVLPAHVTPERFMRVVQTAIVNNPDLALADRRTLYTECVKCAQDGLIPDGREAALTIFNTKEKRDDGTGRKVDHWVKKVKYMPMVYGILKLMRNSGEVKSVTANVAYEKDEFEYWMDDSGEHITFKPNLREARGMLLCAFCRIETKEGGIYINVMTREQIDRVMAVSKSKDKDGKPTGPWKDWYDEMAIKSAIRRCSKRAPMSPEVERVVTREDDMYELQRRQALIAKSGSEAARQLLGISAIEHQSHASFDSETGEIDAEANTEGDSEPTDEYKPQFDKPAAIKAIKESGSLPDLNKAWTSIALDYEMSKREIDPEIDEAVKAQREFLAKV